MSCQFFACLLFDSTKIGENSDISKCFEDFVSQALGFLTRNCATELRTYILVNGTKYTLTRTDGIEIAPEKTYFSYAGQDITFTLYFPPISDTATSIDLIESIDSEWKFYGIKIR